MLGTDCRLINPEARIETTNECNTHCITCPREKMTRPKCTMTFGRFCDLVDEVVDLGCTFISPFGYGEPLMDPGIEGKIRYASKRVPQVFLTTNAGLLTKTRATELIESGLTSIRFSVHAICAPHYMKVHHLDYGLVTENIDTFLKLNDDQGSPVTTSVSVIPMNDELLDAIRARWEPKVDYLEVWRPHNWCDGRGYRRPQRFKKSCGRPLGGPLQILADGRMTVCCFDYDGKMAVGDTNEETVIKILGGYKMERIRQQHRAGKLNGLPCFDCDQLNEYDETDSPLIYSNREQGIGKTSSTKTVLPEIR
jgi:hypothetical protein